MDSLNPFWAEENAVVNVCSPFPAQQPAATAAEPKKKRTYNRKKPQTTATAVAPPPPPPPPTPMVAAATADSALLSEKDLFLSSESESDSDVAPVAKTSKKDVSNFVEVREPLRAVPLRSWMSQRVAGGYTTQSDPTRAGDYYVEIRVYNTREVEKCPANERWKHSVLALKLATNTNTRFWKSLSNTVTAGRDEFKHIQPVLFPNNIA